MSTVSWRDVELDIGCGFGHFLIREAAENPDKLIIGVESLPYRCDVVNRALRSNGLKNAAVAEANALTFLRTVPDSSVSAVHVYFPSPCSSPESVTDARLVDSEFESEVHRVLIAGGRVRIVTDIKDYFDDILGVFRREHWWRRDWRISAQAPWIVGTSCEWLYRGRGHAIHYAQYVKFSDLRM